MRVRALVFVVTSCFLAVFHSAGQDQIIITNGLTQITEGLCKDDGNLFYMPDGLTWQVFPLDYWQPKWIDFSEYTLSTLRSDATFSANPCVLNQSQYGVQPLHLTVTLDLLSGDLILRPACSTQELGRVSAPTDYQPGQWPTGCRVVERLWQEWQTVQSDPDWQEWYGSDAKPVLTFDIQLADINDEPAYDAALAAGDAAYAEGSAMSALSLGSMGMFDSEESGGDEVGTESFDPCSMTNFFIFGISKNVESWMKLTWTSQSNTLYTVQYAEELSTNTVWRPAIENYPSQGCSTIWSDTGDLLAIPPRDRPRDVTKRFYRVMKSETLTNGVPTVSVSIYSNDTANAIITFEVSATASTNRFIDRTSIYIDGIWYGNAYDSPYRITVDTKRLLNGDHTVIGTADDSGSDVEPGETASDGVEPTAKTASAPLALTTSNFISVLSVKYPLFRPSQGQTQEVSATLGGVTNWVVNIKSAASGTTVRSFSGTSSGVLALWDGKDSGGFDVASGAYNAEVNTVPPVSMPFPPTMPFVTGNFGTAGVMWQGHHPSGSAYSAPRRYPSGPNIQFSSTTQPAWGRLKSTYDIGNQFRQMMQQFGYTVPLYKKDDEVTGADLRKASAGGSNSFNSVNIGLYVGHAAAAKPAYYEVAIGFPVAYIPIWNSKSSTVDWVRTTESEFGSTNLHWMALLVCSYLRDDPRGDVIYPDLKNNLVLPMNTGLHILCSYKTEAWLTANFSGHWIPALMGFAGAGNSTVIQAWEYARSKTQPGFPRDLVPNKARSIYWPECFSDHVFGYGSQTEPDSGNTQDAIMEYDTP
jgi:hypothetical protein